MLGTYSITEQWEVLQDFKQGKTAVSLIPGKDVLRTSVDP